MNTPARILSIVFAFLLLAYITPVSAQMRKLSPYPTRKVMMEEHTRDRAEKIRATVERMLVRYEKRLENYESFLRRVRARRDKLVEMDKSVIRLDAFLVTADDNLKNATTAVAAARVNLEDVNYAGTNAEIKTSVMTEARKIREAMTKLNSSMSQAVHQLKNTAGAAESKE